MSSRSPDLGIGASRRGLAIEVDLELASEHFGPAGDLSPIMAFPRRRLRSSPLRETDMVLPERARRLTRRRWCRIGFMGFANFWMDAVSARLAERRGAGSALRGRRLSRARLRIGEAVARIVAARARGGAGVADGEKLEALAARSGRRKVCRRHRGDLTDDAAGEALRRGRRARPNRPQPAGKSIRRLV